MPEIGRFKIQELCVQLMYSFLIKEEAGIEIDFINALEEACDAKYEDCDIYLKEVLINCLKHQDKITNYVESYLNKWKFSRLNQVVQAIFIVTIAEFYLVEEKIDKAVAINNAVEFAKKFGDGGEKDYKYVNAVLQNCLEDGKNILLG
ncbi:MAG: transcription antitermination protein NusB [Bacilli bacterium]|nr:transcription antitermination protein NusB [Bacilli bacterium]